MPARFCGSLGFSLLQFRRAGLATVTIGRDQPAALIDTTRKSPLTFH
jgi:hypothetical protein